MDQKEIRPACEHRFTAVEKDIYYIRKNDIPHLAKDIKDIKKLIYVVLGAMATGVISLFFALIQGHLKF